MMSNHQRLTMCWKRATRWAVFCAIAAPGSIRPVSAFKSGAAAPPGLRREEVAQRANISPTWYTWLEQGRGGAPSADVLNRIAAGMMLTEPEREHMFMLALGHPPEPRYREIDGITPRLQRVLDTMALSPALIRTATWDVVAWNNAAAALLTDYALLPRKQRNILRLMFSSERIRDAQEDWLHVARYVVGSFRADAARAGAGEEIRQLVEELSQSSADFAALWRSNDIAGHGDGVKRIRHPDVGLIELEFSTFAVEGRPDLNMLVYNPATPEGVEQVRRLIEARNRQA